LKRQLSEWHAPRCPPGWASMSIFSPAGKAMPPRFAICRHHKVYEVVLVRLICMDLASTYRALARKHFPQACIVADRFPVIRLINQHVLACWRDLDPMGARHRGLLSLMRRHEEHLKPEQRVRLQAYLAVHPVLQVIYEFKQRLCQLLLLEHRTRRQCRS
jgi:transposase